MWGTLVWLAMTSGMRRGELCAPMVGVDLDEGVVDVRRSYTILRGVGTEKDTKTHQMRRIALDTETVVLLREHQRRCQQQCEELGVTWSDDSYLFASVSGQFTAPYSPDAVSNRYKKMANRLGNQDAHSCAAPLLGDGVADGGCRPENRRRSTWPRWGRSNHPARLCSVGGRGGPKSC